MGAPERIKEFIEKQTPLTPTAFAVHIGVDPTGFLRVLKGQTQVSQRLVNKICGHYPLNPNWILEGEAPMLLSPIKSESISEEVPMRPHIPAEVLAGITTGFAESVVLRDCEMRPVVEAFPDYDYTINIKGDSMEPKYESGDIIAIKQIKSLVEWGKTYVVSTEDGAVIKRLYPSKIDRNSINCVSYNPDYPPFELDKASVKAVYKVVGLLRIC